MLLNFVREIDIRLRALILPQSRKEIQFPVRESEDREIVTVILETAKRKTSMYTVVGCSLGRENGRKAHQRDSR